MSIDLYYTSASAPCRSVLMISKILGIELNKTFLNLFAGDQLKPEFVKLNPQHVVPTLVDNGFVLWESYAIVTYLVEKYGKDDSLYPKCPKKRAVVNQRLYFDMGTLYKSFGDYFYPQYMHNQPADAEKLKKLGEALDLLEVFLGDNTYVTGDTLTVADIVMLASVATFDAVGIDIKKHAIVNKWYEHCKKTVAGFDENWEGAVAFKQLFEDLKAGKYVYPPKK